MDSRALSEKLLHMYYTTLPYPWTRHHLDSYDQFLSTDLPAIIKSSNPILSLQQQIGTSGEFAYKAELFIGGKTGTKLLIGSPTLSLQNTKEVRLLFPNEARLRNLTYASLVQADIYIRVTFTRQKASGEGTGFTQTVVELDPEVDTYSYLRNVPLFSIPIMLHSRYCILNGKPEEFLKEAGECIYDYGGYFIVDGSEKVLITHQEQAFNTLYVTNQEREPEIATYASISCLSPTTRQVRRIAFGLLRRQNTLQVSIPFVRKAVPVFVLFRALGIQADEDIIRLILPNEDDAETKVLEPMLQESIAEAFPFLDTYSAVQYIKVLTKGFSEAHVIDILHNHLFVHVEDRPMGRATFLAECVRKVLRVAAGIDPKTDRDDIRNQRCMSSGVLTRMLFQGVYSTWLKASARAMDEEFKYNTSSYSGDNFLNLFTFGSLTKILLPDFLTKGLMRGFKGKWGSKQGEEKSGVLQALSRLSYMDFLSHCRRVVLEFDTTMKLQGPRRLHPSQFGYFCTNETPSGASIGITKNLSNFATISTATDATKFIQWLLTKGGVIPCEQATSSIISRAVPVFVNAGILGYTVRPMELRAITKLLKWTGCLPPSVSIGFSIRERRVFFYLDEGRPLRPLIHLGERGKIPMEFLEGAKSWRDLVLGTYSSRDLAVSDFVDPLPADATFQDYFKELSTHTGVIEYVDPYESNEAYVATFPEYIQPETSHLEIHPSTIFGLMTSMIPYSNHNQSPRNQLSCSQSKQGLSVYATNFQNRFDNQVHVLSYGEAPIVRTRYYDYVAGGQMGYGQNIILAMGCFSGYNQEDGIVINHDAVMRGLFHSACYRSYEAFEEDDKMSHSSTRIANPANAPMWVNLKPGLDYSKLDERGIIREGSLVDESTVLVGRYIQTQGGEIRDASLTAQVWTSGRVEKIAVTVGNTGLALVKIRVLQYRIPELGDKFSNRHGQKGTIGMLIRGHDMPRTENGLIPDMMMNSHAIPSRMTMAQLLESLLGKTAAYSGAIGDATAFMNEGSPAEAMGRILQDQFGMQPMGEELLYDGTTGVMIPSTIFMGNVYTMRLKHMTEDKWNARAEGRREQRTHQPTGGRGNQGGLRIGEMDCWALEGHGLSEFFQESLMKRSDGTEFTVCNGCGTIPITNEKTNLAICPLCDGPVRYIGETATNLELLPPVKRSITTFSKVEMPYATKLLEQELSTYMNIGMRLLTTHDLQKLEAPNLRQLSAAEASAALTAPLPQRVLPDTQVPEFVKPVEEPLASTEDLSALSAVTVAEEETKEEVEYPIQEGPMPVPAPAPQQQMVAPTGPYMVIPLQQQQQQQQPQEGQEQQPQQPQQQQPQQQVIITSVGPPPAQVLAPPLPGAPPMIAVDTSAPALKAQGLSQAPAPVRSAIRGKKVGFANQQQEQSQNGNVRINVIKRE